MFKKFFVAVLALQATPVLAAETVYSCDATYTSRWGYVAPQVVFFLDEQNEKARVLDGVVQGVNGGPIEAQFSKRSDAVRTITWTLNNIKTTSSTVDGTYKANLNLSKMTYTVKVTLSGTGSDPRGQGRCKILR